MTITVPSPLTFYVGQEPTIGCTFRDSTGAVIDFSSGWSFEAKIGDSIATYVTQSDGITGAATAPNITISLDSGSLDAVLQGDYLLQVKATLSGHDHYFQTPLQIRAALL